jgi:hypothetical protein
MRADPEVRRLLQERYGITDLSLVRFDPWSIHESESIPGRVIQVCVVPAQRPHRLLYGVFGPQGC